MIQVYTQYSFGGFRIYKIEDAAEERLDASKVVATGDFMGYPDEAAIFIDRRGAKIAYCYLKDKLVLTIKEIPSLDKDSDGRPVNCAVQFIGDFEDRQALDNVAISICNDLKEFGSFFAGLFSVRGGFKIEGNKLFAYISSCVTREFSGESPLLELKKRKSGVILFVPLSDSFLSDSFVRTKTMEELHFSAADLKHCLILSHHDLLQQQGRLSWEASDADLSQEKKEEVVPVQEKPLEQTGDGSEEERQDAGLKDDDLEKECRRSLQAENEQLKAKIAELTRKNEKLKEDLNRGNSLVVLSDNYKEKYGYCKKLCKYLIYLAAAEALALLLVIIF